MNITNIVCTRWSTPLEDATLNLFGAIFGGILVGSIILFLIIKILSIGITHKKK